MTDFPKIRFLPDDPNFGLVTPEQQRALQYHPPTKEASIQWILNVLSHRMVNLMLAGHPLVTSPVVKAAIRDWEKQHPGAHIDILPCRRWVDEKES